LEGCQYRFLRTIIGKKWEDFISYLSIFEILETKKISITAIEPLVRMKRLQCLCKILKMDNSRLLRKVAFSETIEGKRKKGRPLLSWRQAISQDIKAFHLEHIYTLSECDQIKQLSQTPLHLEIADMEWKQTVQQKKLTKNTKSKLILI